MTALCNEETNKITAKLAEANAMWVAFEQRVLSLDALQIPEEESLLHQLKRQSFVGKGDWFDADDWIWAAVHNNEAIGALEKRGAKFLREMVPKSAERLRTNDNLWVIFSCLRATPSAVRILDDIAIARAAKAAKVAAAEHNRCKCLCKHCRDCDGGDGEDVDDDECDQIEYSTRKLLGILGTCDEVKQFLQVSTSE